MRLGRTTSLSLVLSLLLTASLTPTSAITEQSVEVEEVTFGHGLHGCLLIPQGDQVPAIIVYQPMGLSFYEMLWWGIATPFLERGYAVLLFDPRGYGLSSGFFTFKRSNEDVSSAIEFLDSRPEIDGNRIGIFGMSLGAALSLEAAARDERIGAVALWGCPVDFQTTMGNFVWFMSEQWGLGPLAPHIPMIVTPFIQVLPLLVDLAIPCTLCLRPLTCERFGSLYEAHLPVPCELQLVLCPPVGIPIRYGASGASIWENPTVSPAGGIAVLRDLLSYDPQRCAEHIAPRPILIVQGTGDELIPREGVESLGQIENVNIVWYTGSHMLDEEALAWIFPSVLSFFDENL